MSGGLLSGGLNAQGVNVRGVIVWGGIVRGVNVQVVNVRGAIVRGVNVRPPYFTLNLWKLALRGHLNTEARTRDRTRNFLITRTIDIRKHFRISMQERCRNRSATAPQKEIIFEENKLYRRIYLRKLY